MRNDKDSDERYHIIEKDKERVTEDKEVLKMGKLSSKKNDNNIEKYDYERNWMDMSDDKDSDERDQNR